MSDVFDLSVDCHDIYNAPINGDLECIIAAINAYDENQKRIRHLISCGNELEHVIDMQRERIDLLEGEFKRICDANALLENQLENAIAEISELKKKARGY